MPFRSPLESPSDIRRAAHPLGPATPLVKQSSLDSPSLASNMALETQQRLDDDIAALTLVLCNLRTQRNTLSPISCLPPEILAFIFICCARSHQKMRGIPGWVNVSYVCRHWREVALNCSALWSFLFVSSQHWTEELLARSKMAPLKVRVDLECRRELKLNLLERLGPQAVHIQQLCLQLEHWEANRVLSSSLLSSPAPLLQTLQISVAEPPFHSGSSLISRVLFGDYTPGLRELELINYAFPLTSPTLSGLTYLRLHNLDPSFQPTLESLRVTLSRMQGLVHLHIENALPSLRANSIGQSFENSEKLGFPKLSRLSIVAPFTAVVFLLSCFDVPLQTEVRLRCCFEADVKHHTPLYPLIAQRFIASRYIPSSSVPIVRTCIIEKVSGTIGFVFSTAERDSSHRAYSAPTTSYDQLNEDWDCNIPLKVDLDLRLSPLEDLIEDICRSIPITNLRSAHLSFDYGTTFSMAFWKKSFGYLRELGHIKLTGIDLQGFALALSPTFHYPKEESGNLETGSVQVFAPTLKELELHGTPFFKACNSRRQGNPGVYTSQCLRDALSDRQSWGYGLQRLLLVRCVYIRDDDVEDLRGAVTDVVWDGVTGAIPASGSEDEAEDDVD